MRTPELSGIAVMKPALRRAAVVDEIAAAYVDSDTVDLTYHPSRFDQARTLHVQIEGISDPLDSNGRENLVVSEDGDPDRKLKTIGLHMIVSIAPHGVQPTWCKCGCNSSRLCVCAVECAEPSHRAAKDSEVISDEATS